MMENREKLVLFDKYCDTCEYKDVLDSKDPCDTCLGTPVNEDSHKPINYKKKD